MRPDEAVAGSGLRLAMVQDLVDLYGGTLELHPAVPCGMRAALFQLAIG